MKRISRRWVGWLLGLVVVAVVAVAGKAEARPEGDRYYFIIFSYNGPALNLARESHTWASFVRVSPWGDYELSTISWLPRSGVVRPLPREAGHNFSLEETLRLARGHRVWHGGPYEILPAVYERAMSRIAFLESGAVDYKMMDGRTRGPALADQPGGAVNCIHAVSDIMGFLDTGVNWGFPASRMVLDHFRGGILRYPRVHPEIAELIRLRELFGRF